MRSRDVGFVAAAVAAGLSTAALTGRADAQLPLPLPTGTSTTTTTTSVPPPPVVEPAVPAQTSIPGNEPAGRSAVTGAGLGLPLRSLWHLELDQPAGAPVVSGTTLVVRDATTVRAFALATGAPVWAVPAAGGIVGIAADKVILFTGTGTVTALDIASGAQAWTATPGGQGSGNHNARVTGPGVVVEVDNSLVLLDGATGAQRWQVPLGDQTDSFSLGRAAVAGDRIFLDGSGACTARALDLRDGHRLWDAPRTCANFDSVADPGEPAGSGDGFLVTGGVLRDATRGDVLAQTDGSPAPGPTPDLVVGGVGVGFINGGTQDELRGTDLATGRKLWEVPELGSDPEYAAALGVGAALVELLPSGALEVLDATKGTSLFSARLGAQASGGFAQLAAGEGVLVAVRGTAIDGLAAAGDAVGASPFSLTVPKRRGVTAGDVQTVRTRVGGTLLPSQARLQVDPYPFGAFAPTGVGLATTGRTVSARYRPDRNVRVRVGGAAPGFAPSASYTLFVYARIRLSVRNVANVVTAQITVKGSSAIRYHGRRVHLYVGHRGTRAIRRLGSATLSGPARGKGVGRVRFRALPAGGPAPYLLACVPGVERLGQGAADSVQRACGRASARI